MEGLGTIDVIELSKLAEAYASDHYGELVGVGIPMLDRDTRELKFPILCYTVQGYLAVGSMTVNSEGSVASAPSRNEVEASTELMLGRLSRTA